MIWVTSNSQTLCKNPRGKWWVMGGATPQPRGARRVQTDGRVERGLRTRHAIVTAHSDLLRTGDLKPTAARIAERAGVSVRTLWTVFGDMEGLLQATTEYWFETDDALRGTIDCSLPLPERIDLFCDERSRRLENISPAARAATLMEPYSPALRASRIGHVQRVIDEVDTVFAPELEAAGGSREVLRDAIVVVTSWASWSMLRDDLERTVQESRAAMRQGLADMLSASER